MKRMKFIAISAIVLALLLLLQGCIPVDPQDPHETTREEGTPTVQVQHYYVNMEYAYQTQVDQSILTTDLNKDYLLLANKDHALGEDYVPADLKLLTCATFGDKDIKLNGRAAEALDLMLQEMRAAGVTDVLVTSAYRSYEYQRLLFNHYLVKEQSGISSDAIACFGKDYIQKHYYDKGVEALNAADARQVVLSYSAYPGTSEHQTGLCVDFITSTMDGNLTTDFALTPAFAWLRQNAYRFGFILRYPEGKEGVTGYTYEPWHYRFVGREAATDIYFNGITLEEYLANS